MKPAARDAANERFVKWFTGSLTVAILIGGLLFLRRIYGTYRDLLRRDAKLAQQIEEKQARINRFQADQDRYHTDRDFVELVARQNRRVYPGEYVFIFDEAAAPQKAERPAAPKKTPRKANKKAR